MDTITLSRLQELAPVFARRLNTVLLTLEGEEINGRIVQGVRSPGEQDELYAKGRTKPGEACSHDGIVRPVGTCNVHPLGLKVTNASGLKSWHPYGLAADWVPDADAQKPGLQPDWNRESPKYKRFVGLSVAQGLAVGDAWTGKNRDTPHVQPADIPVTPTGEDMQVFRDGGSLAVQQKYGMDRVQIL